MRERDETRVGEGRGGRRRRGRVDDDGEGDGETGEGRGVRTFRWVTSAWEDEEAPRGYVETLEWINDALAETLARARARRDDDDDDGEGGWERGRGREGGGWGGEDGGVARERDEHRSVVERPAGAGSIGGGERRRRRRDAEKRRVKRDVKK